MTHIKQTDVIPPQLIVAAKCYHQRNRCSRIRAARMYTASDKPDGRGMQEFLLTRYVNQLGVAMSSILQVRPHPSAASGCHLPHGGEGKETELTEVCREDRKHEEQMIMAWCTQMGGGECDPQNMT